MNTNITTTSALTLNFSITHISTSADDIDAAAAGTSSEFRRNARVDWIRITILGDDVGESDEVFKVTLLPGDGYTLGARTVSTVTILNDDLGAPTLTATSASEGLRLSWTAPTDTGGSAITGYKVRWADTRAPDVYLNTGGADGEDVPGGASATTHAITGLVDNTTYQVQIAAVNASGTGIWSEVREGTSATLAVICLGKTAITDFRACQAAAKAGYRLSENLSGAQTIVLSAILPSPSDGLTTFTLAVTNGANAIVANTDTDGALPAFDGAEIVIADRTTSASASYAITPKKSGDGGSLRIAFAVTGTYVIDTPSTDPALRGTTFALVEAGIDLTATNADGACPAAHGAAVTARQLAEGGAGVAVCVSLSAQPPGDVNVACAAADTALVAAAPARLTFTAANWETAQKLTLTAPDNNIAAAAEATPMLTCRASAAAGSLFDGASGGVMLTVTDNDVVSGSGSLTAGNVGESDGAQVVEITATLGGNIASQTDCTVTLAIGTSAISGSKGDALAVAPGDYAAFTPPGLTIAAGKLSGSAMVAITPVVDSDAAKESIPLSATAAACGGTATVNFGNAEILIIDFVFAMLDGTTGAGANDGILVARYLAGVRGTALTAGLNLATTLNAAEVAADAAASIAGNLSRLDVDEANGTTAADGIMIARYFFGVTSGAGLYEGQSESSKEETIKENIRKLAPQ